MDHVAGDMGLDQKCRVSTDFLHDKRELINSDFPLAENYETLTSSFVNFLLIISSFSSSLHEY